MSTESDQTIFASIMNEAPAAAPASPVNSDQPPPPETEGYQPLTQEVMPQAEQPAPGQETVPAQQQSQQRTVPLPELMETRKRAQAAEAEARAAREETAKLKDMLLGRLLPPQPQAPQPAPIDPVEDPQGFARAIEARIEQRFLNESLNHSERQARAEFGSDAVDAALQAAKDSGYAQVFVSKPDAYREMVNWHKAQQLQQQVGDNSSAYMNELKAKVRAEVLAEMRAGTPPPANLPPTLASATKAGGTPEVIPGPKDFFKEMMNPQRQKRG